MVLTHMAGNCRFLKIVAGLLAGVCVSAAAETGPKTTLSVGDIIKKALERAEWQKEQEKGRVFTAEVFEVVEHLDRKGATTSRDETVYRAASHEGHRFFEKVRINGRELTAREAKQEKARKEKFLRELERDKGKENFSQPKGNRVDFNRDLMGRYRATLAGREKIHGREAYVIEFEPKSGKLPVKRRVDYALNKSNGKVWVDAEDFGVARVEFHLMEPVKLWAGLLGKVTEIDGSVETIRNGEGLWLPRELKLYINYRILFLSFHRRSTDTWRHLSPGSRYPGMSEGPSPYGVSF